MFTPEDSLRPSPVEKLYQDAQETAAFNELTDLVLDLCLSDKAAFYAERDRLLSEKMEGEEYQAMGLWGLRCALEVTSHEVVYLKQKERNGSMPLPLRLLKNPYLFAGPPIPEVQATFEAMGICILRESFACLGSDAPQKVVEFQNAKTTKQQIKVIDWLLDRAHDIRKTVHDGETEVEEDELIEEIETITTIPTGEITSETGLVEIYPAQNLTEEDLDIEVQAQEESTESQEQLEPSEQFNYYLPLRLSPKVMGVYPETTMTPTCLGTSILLASFFEQADVPYIHAGVARTASQQIQYVQTEVASYVLKADKKFDLDLPDSDKQLMNTIIEKYDERYKKRIGAHAAVLVRSIEDKWILLDPMFRTTLIIGSSDNPSIEEAHQKLQDTAQVAPGLELSIRGFAADNTIWWQAVAGELAKKSIPEADVEAVLDQAVETGELGSVMLPFFYDQLFKVPEYGNYAAVIMALRAWDMSKDPDNYYIDRVMHCLQTYVFRDAEANGIENTLQRCVDDPQYRARRIRDLQRMPLFLVLSLVTEELKAADNFTLHVPHAAYEVGLPHYRIGASVMSDFASYFQDEDMSQEFWLKNWPSMVSMYDHLPQEHNRKTRHAARYLRKMLFENELRYFGSYGIVNEFHEHGRG